MLSPVLRWPPSDALRGSFSQGCAFSGAHDWGSGGCARDRGSGEEGGLFSMALRATTPALQAGPARRVRTQPMRAVAQTPEGKQAPAAVGAALSLALMIGAPEAALAIGAPAKKAAPTDGQVVTPVEFYSEVSGRKKGGIKAAPEVEKKTKNFATGTGFSAPKLAVGGSAAVAASSTAAAAAPVIDVPAAPVQAATLAAVEVLLALAASFTVKAVLK
eukprot:CAMPEP_0170162744 /NCGR_PEP_ID=MMETSP0033_2-20121228/77251_1 /TAXON_ID=195969 /ORGANISM="Dolichomastix tenuilepis, Strain CCMP3274" /LENGTH=216 /DNA_ID=CAMNT_0010400373 /DNA_START=287 /DNA_END=937 /DNA_ORIENTATION=+